MSYYEWKTKGRESHRRIRKRRKFKNRIVRRRRSIWRWKTSTRGITAFRIIKKQYGLLLLFDDILLATEEGQKYVKEIKRILDEKGNIIPEML